MGIDTGMDIIKSAGSNTLAIGAGVAAGVGAGIVTESLIGSRIGNRIAESAVKECSRLNSVFKEPALKALQSEKILCTTEAEAWERVFATNRKMPQAQLKEETKAFMAMKYSPNDLASRINNKIDYYIGMGLKKVTEKFPKREKNTLAQQTAKGLNAMAKQDVVFADLNKMSLATFHEMGHVKNYQSKRLGKILNTLKHPLLKKAALATAFIGIALPPSKDDSKGDKNNSLVRNTGKFLKDNCVAISAAATVPTLLEEGLASIKGAKIANKVMTPDKLKIVNKLNGKVWLTYLLGAAVIPLGVYIANKTRNALA